MKRFSTLLAALGLLALAAPCASLATALPRPAATPDTIIVKLPNQAVMTLFVKNKVQLHQLRTYKLDSLMVVLDDYITKAEAAGKNATSDEVTVEYYPAKDHPGTGAPEQIRITVRNEDAQGKPQPPTAERVDVTLGRAMGVAVIESKDEQGNGKVSVHIDHSNDAHEDSVRQAKRVAKANRAVHSNFNIDLGVNTLVNREPQANGVDYELRPLGSRYISLNWHYDFRIGRKGSPFHLLTGPELAFNNYMLDKNQRFYDLNNYTSIAPDPTRSLEKSKLAVTSINLPLMPMLNFQDKKGKQAFRIGAGGFIGYRLSSHTKLKFEEDGRTRKEKDRGSYNLEDFQYGLQGTIGVRGIDLFVKYNLNNTFRDNRGPQAQTLSFGISLLD